MKQSGIIFNYAIHSNHHKAHTLYVANIFKAFTLGGVLSIVVLVSPLAVIEAKYRIAQATHQPEEQVAVSMQNTDGSFSKLISQKYAKLLNPVDSNFSLIIPKIGINSKVFANVDPSNKEQYNAALTSGIAHADGTYLPGNNGTVYLFAHSTDYIWNISRFNAVFYLLKELQYGDEVNIVYQGQRYRYKVTDKKVVAANDTAYLAPVKGEERLIMQTCWPPGTTWKRLLIFAKADQGQPKQLSYSH